MAFRLPASLCLAFLLAGCLSADTLDDTETRLATLQARDCWDAAGRFEIPVDEAESMLPAGFEPLIGGEFNDSAVLFITSLECEVSVDGQTWEPTAEIHSMILVAPPEEFRIQREGLQSHGFWVDLVTSSSLASEFYGAWSVPHVAGGVTVELLVDTPVARQSHAQAAADDGDLILETINTGPLEPYGAGTVRAFYVAEVNGEDRLHQFDVSWDSIPNTGLAVGTMTHGHFGQLASRDLFHAWTYDWNITIAELGPL